MSGRGLVDWGEGWVRLTPWTGEEPLPLPLVVGAKGPGLEEGLAGWVVEAEEAVAVPAGEFRALRCALRTPDLESVLWIVPLVGVIRETQGAPGLPPELQRELLRWSGGPPRESAPGEGARAAPTPTPRRSPPRSTRRRPGTQ